MNSYLKKIIILSFESFLNHAHQASIITSLPTIHRDPFDRMLIAQAISEPLRLLTSYSLLKKYSALVEIV